jgi:hypothetical protein
VLFGLAVFFGTVPLAVALMRRDHQRVDRILDLYIEIFQASAAAIIGALRIFRRREVSSSDKALPPRDSPITLPSNDPRQITKQRIVSAVDEAMVD